MSQTCLHSIADAPRHPECEGCRAVPEQDVHFAQMLDQMTPDERRYAAMGQFSLPSSRPIAGISETIAALQRRLAAACDVPDHILFDQSSQRSLLDPTGDLDAERAAMEETERPGTWFGDDGADGRWLTQEQTDMLVRAELWRHAVRHVTGLPDALNEELRGIIGELRMLELSTETGDGYSVRRRSRRASQQRGGIDSDPLVRLLAWRAWGDRDRFWLQDRGVRKGDAITLVSSETCARAWPADHHIGPATHDARPGETLWLAYPNPPAYERTTGAQTMFRVSDRPREKPQPSEGEWFLTPDVGTPLFPSVPADLAALRGYGMPSIRETFRHGYEVIPDIVPDLIGQVFTGSHPWRLGDRVTANGHGYVVTAVDANTFKLGTAPRAERFSLEAEPKPLGGTRRPNTENQQPPVPPWAKERRRRQPRSGR
jgi:hypothetical protein